MRLTREQQQAATRERVLAAATTTFLENGFHGTTIAAVSESAGFTSGAIYSNFANKEDLVLAVLDRHATERSRLLAEALSSATSLEDLLARVSRWYGSLIDTNPEWPVLQIDLALNTRHNPALRPKLRNRHRATQAAVAQVLRQQSTRFGVDLPLDADTLASAIHGLGEGLAVQQLLDPATRAAEVFHQSLGILLDSPGGASRAGSPSGPASRAGRRRGEKEER
jgi:AcrR family transcriptional regulator